MSRNIPITEFDTLTVNPSMQILKALVPFLDYPMQRQISLIIRITELQQTMRFFSNPSYVSGFSSSPGCTEKIHSIDDIFNNEKLLDSLLVYCPENYASMIKTFRQFSKMSDLFNAMNLSNEDMGNMFNAFFSGDSNEKANDGSNRTNNPNDNSTADNNKTENPSDKLTPNLNPGGLGNILNFTTKNTPNPAMTNSLLNSFMKPEQQAMYDEYIRQLNNLNFDESESNPNPQHTDGF